ncbi:MAG TPA: hypothetical protein VGS22_19345 [Thermoanaerobaculia bacterium]|nr:hypothetical protein [Thermoanaerobaculia bacterium]
MPDPLHRQLKARAALAGLSLSDYLLREMKRLAERSTWDEIIARLESRDPVRLTETVASAVAAERESR